LESRSAAERFFQDCLPMIAGTQILHKALKAASLPGSVMSSKLSELQRSKREGTPSIASVS